jgi:FKBP-type peptidyl-prolyl cis-trans isomerase 2
LKLMSEVLSKGDFVEVNYSGYIKDGHVLFDTTIKSVADHEGMQLRQKYMPVIICIGHGHLLPGLDHKLTGQKLGKHTIELTDLEAFGKKDPKLLQLVPRNAFAKEKIAPVPGLEVTVDNHTGIIRTVSGGRIIVDFNHPLASRDLIYEVEVLRKVTDKSEQIKSLLALTHIPFDTVVVQELTATISLKHKLPKEYTDLVVKNIAELTGVEAQFQEKEKV